MQAGVDAVRDLNELRVFIASGAAATPLDALCAPLLLGVMFMIHPVYGFLGLVGIAMLLLFGLATEWRGRPAVIAATQRRAALAGTLSSRLRESAVTEGLGMLPAIARRWSAEQDVVLSDLRVAGQRADVLTVAAQVCRLLLQACLMSLGALMILSHATTPGSLMGANMLLAKVLQPFDHLVDSWRHWSLAQASWGRVSALLRNAQSAAEIARIADAAGSKDDAMPGLDVRSVQLSKGGRLLLDDISFSLPPGSALGVTGPNGCGKSTLLRLLAGVSPPDAGSIRLFGDPLDEQRSFVGYLPQAVGLLDGTIADNVMRFRQHSATTTEGTIEACRQAGVHDLVSRMQRGYETPVGAPGGSLNLSGGQHQRIGLARALFGTPRLLVLDEPDASIDHEGEEALLKALAAAKAAGACVLVVTHRPRLLAAMDFHICLEQGRITSFQPTARPVPAKGQNPVSTTATTTSTTDTTTTTTTIVQAADSRQGRNIQA
jgi:ATP-binding cassette subfamily C protein